MTTDYLAFTLAAPMASFGGLAVGERRACGDHPAKSQIIGLIAAALGIPRADEGRQASLAASLGYAVRVDEAGTLASDYHTAQTAKDASIRRHVKSHGPLATRRDELACDDIKTILSMREFRTGVLSTVVLWLRQSGPATLAEIATRIQTPSFTLFAGRKSFPLMLPCRPLIVHAATLEAALGAYDAHSTDAIRAVESALVRGRTSRLEQASTIYADADAITNINNQRLEQRRDVPEARSKWRFGLRQEIVLQVTKEGAV